MSAGLIYTMAMMFLYCMLANNRKSNVTMELKLGVVHATEVGFSITASIHHKHASQDWVDNLFKYEISFRSCKGPSLSTYYINTVNSFDSVLRFAPSLTCLFFFLKSPATILMYCKRTQTKPCQTFFKGCIFISSMLYEALLSLVFLAASCLPTLLDHVSGRLQGENEVLLFCPLLDETILEGLSGYVLLQIYIRRSSLIPPTQRHSLLTHLVEQ